MVLHHAIQEQPKMESIELCARLSRFLRSDGGDSSPHAPTVDVQVDMRDTLSAVVAFYDDQPPGAALAKTMATGVDDMMIVALQRLLLTTLRDYDHSTQEKAFVALGLLLQRCLGRLSPARVVDILQTCVLYLPTPAAAAPSPSSTSGTHTPEELQLLVLRSLDSLLSAASAKAAVQLLTSSQDHVHFLAYTVSSLIQIAEKQRHRELAVLAIHVLVQLLDCVSLPHVLRQFFPGVSVGMWKTMNSPLQSSKVTAAAVTCLSAMISSCLSDKVNALSARPSQYSLDHLRQLQSAPTSSDELPPTQSSDPWVTGSADKIDMLLSQLLSSRSIGRQSWRVRLAVVGICRAVVVECRSTLPNSFLSCFEELMVLRTHAIPKVAQSASDALEQLKSTLLMDEWLSLEPQFAERFHMQLSTLALKSSSEHESASVHLAEVLIGYLRFQRASFQVVLDDAMPSIYRSLCHIVAFDSLDVDLLRHEQVQLYHQDEGESQTLTLPYFQKRFRHFHDESSIAVVMRLLRDVGATATPAVVVDTAFSLLQAEDDVEVEREAVLVVLNECLRAQVGVSSTEDNVHMVGRILDDLLALPAWLSSQRCSKNASALMVECVGVCVELVGSAFDAFVMFVLYPLVEKLGDPATQVDRAAMTTLQKISFYCGYHADLHALFSANMDYFVDALCARLELLDAYPQSPQVVEALLRHATVASLPLVDEITRSLLRAVDLYQDEPSTTTTLLRSLQLLLDSFAQQSERDSIETTQVTEMESEMSPLSSFLMEMQAWTEPLGNETAIVEEENPKAMTVAQSIKGAMPVEYEDDDAGSNTVDDDEDKEPPALPFQAQTVDILDRCSYFLADADPTACCLVLATIEKGVRYLRTRRKVLLPLIHRLWPSILHRLSVTNHPILIAAMQLLTALAECAGDFIGNRFVETVWPSVCALLVSIHDSSIERDAKKPSVTRAMLQLSMAESTIEEVATEGKDRVMRGRVTLDMKVLEATLCCLRAVCGNAIAVTSLVPEIMSNCIGFLDARFPESIVSLTEEVLLGLGALNGDEVFVGLASLAQWQPRPPPSQRFPAYAYLPVSSSSKEKTRHDLVRCRANAARVLEKLSSRE